MLAGRLGVARVGALGRTSSRTVAETADVGQGALAMRGQWRGRAVEPWRDWASRMPQLETPDDPALSEGFQLATGALRALSCDSKPG